MSKKSLKRIMVLLLAVVFSVSILSACGNKKTTEEATSSTKEETSSNMATQPTETKQKEEKVIELRFSTTSTTSSADFAELNAAIEKFMAENTNIKIVKDSVDSQTWRTKSSVEFSSDNAPSISWSPLNYAIQFMKDDLIIDWSKVYSDPNHPEFKTWFSDTIRNFSDYGDGRLMLCPSVMSIDGLFYNSELFEKNGWQVPKTVDDVIALAEKCNKAGIATMVTGGKDVRYAWMAAAIMSRTCGIDNMKYLATGDGLLQWDNPKYGFPQAMETFKKMCDAGVFPKDTNGLSASEADQLFVREEAAMYYEGQWKISNWKALGGANFINKVKRIDFPAITGMSVPPNTRVGGTVTGYVISKKQSPEEIEACIKFVKAIVSPEYYKPLVEKGNLYAGNMDLSKMKLDSVTKELVDAFLTAESMVGSNDAAFLHPSIDMAIKKTAMPGLIDKSLNIDAAIAEVKKAAESVHSSSK